MVKPFIPGGFPPGMFKQILSPKMIERIELVSNT